MNKPELSDIVREVIAAGNVVASKDQWSVLNAITSCRTEVLGGHLYRCTGCGKEKACYNSCRNRHCPKCQGGDIAKWLADRSKELLPIPYFHIVFTIPHELNGIALQNKKIIYDILFQAAAETLKQIARNKLGGKIGFIGVLHTWGQKLEAHPHIHCVVPGLILNDDHSVKRTTGSFFLPHKILKVVFRAIFLKLFSKSYSKLEFCGEQVRFREQPEFNLLLSQLTKKHWICYLKKPFAGPTAVLKYLARYTHRVAISNSRIRAFQNGKVTFTYKDYADGCSKKNCSLYASEFVRRFLLHVLPKNFTRVRNFGFLGNRVRKNNLKLFVKHLGSATQSPVAPTLPVCPHCGSQHFQYVRELNSEQPYFPHSNSHTNGELPLVA